MTRVVSKVFLACILAVAAPVAYGDTYVVSVDSNFFDPQEITILTGDVINWDWVSGVHDTTSDDGLWQSDTTFPPFDFQYEFDTAGDYYYYCSVHGGPGFNGMAGIIHVMDPGP
jgi:plastocyanin